MPASMRHLVTSITSGTWVQMMLLEKAFTLMAIFSPLRKRAAQADFASCSPVSFVMEASSIFRSTSGTRALSSTAGSVQAPA